MIEITPVDADFVAEVSNVDLRAPLPLAANDDHRTMMRAA